MMLSLLTLLAIVDTGSQAVSARIAPRAIPRSRRSLAERQHQENLEKRAATWKSIGCISDNSNRVLKVGGSGDTPAKCQASCQSMGYSWAGTEYYNQCYCGTLSSAPGTIPSTTCNTPCSGDSSQMCGGSWAMNLYQLVDSSTPTTTSAPSPTSNSNSNNGGGGPVSLGCYIDDSTRTLGGPSSDLSNNSPTNCMSYCKGYAYAGVEYGGQCFCGNSIVANRKASSDSQCTMKCAGDSTKICGDSWRINIYQISGPISSTTTTTLSTTTTTSKTTTSSSSTTTSRISTLSTTTSSSTPSTTTSKPSTTTTSSSAVSTNNSAINAQVISGGPSPAVPGTRKYLFAHHMVGNTLHYDQSTWNDDVNQAAAAGFDGFALNMGADSYQPNSVAMAYNAAKSKGSGFLVFLSFDVTSLPCGSPGDAQTLVNLVQTYYNHPNQFNYKGKTFVALFSGNYCSFGQGSPLNAWNYFRGLLTAKGISIYLAPSIFDDPSTFSGSNNWFDGHLGWDSAWPMGGSNLDGSFDNQQMSALTPQGKGYIAGVSPCFFTHYSPSSWNKNWIYRSDNWLLATRMEMLIQNRGAYDMAEMLSWNDYGESHYIGPIRQDQPNSQGWTNGMPHTAWLSLLSYYTQAYKYGTYPGSPDTVWLWSRPHPKNGTPTSPTMSRPSNADYTDDNLYVVAILSSPATVVVRSGSNTGTFTNLPAGVNKISIASAVGTIGASIIRNGATIKSWDSTGVFSWNTNFPDWNFNYYVNSF